MSATVLMESPFAPSCCWGHTSCADHLLPWFSAEELLDFFCRVALQNVWAATSHATSPVSKFGNDNTEKNSLILSFFQVTKQQGVASATQNLLYKHRPKSHDQKLSYFIYNSTSLENKSKQPLAAGAKVIADTCLYFRPLILWLDNNNERLW